MVGEKVIIFFYILNSLLSGSLTFPFFLLIHLHIFQHLNGKNCTHLEKIILTMVESEYVDNYSHK